MADVDTSFDRHSTVQFADLTHSEETTNRLLPLLTFDTDTTSQSGPTSALITGPIGNGKRRLARAVAGELDLPFGTVSPFGGPDTESEPTVWPSIIGNVRSAAPCVVILDQISAFAPSSGFGGSATQLRTVNTFLNYFDELIAENCIVIAIANELDDIHWTVRRPARFEVFCPVGNPDADRYELVLEDALGSVPWTIDIDAEQQNTVTEKLEGLSVDDIQVVIQRAVGVMQTEGRTTLHYDHLETTLDRLRTDLDLEADSGDSLFDETSANSFYRYQGHRVGDDTSDNDAMAFTGSLRDDESNETTAAAIQQGISVPDIGYNDIGGLDHVKDVLREAIEWPRNYPELCETMNIDTARGILLYGPPGNGKTMLAKAIANETDSQFISVKGPEVMDKYVGESQKFIANLFEAARERSPTVIFIDEIDSITDERDGEAATDQVVNQLLLELDGLADLSNIVLIGATNRPNLIDDALRRPGRLGTELHVPRPDAPARQEIFAAHLRDRPVADDVTPSWLVEQSADGLSGADIAHICEQAARNTVRRSIQTSDEDRPIEVEANGATVQRADFERSFDEFDDNTEMLQRSGFQ